MIRREVCAPISTVGASAFSFVRPVSARWAALYAAALDHARRDLGDRPTLWEVGVLESTKPPDVLSRGGCG